MPPVRPAPIDEYDAEEGRCCMCGQPCTTEPNALLRGNRRRGYLRERAEKSEKQLVCP